MVKSIVINITLALALLIGAYALGKIFFSPPWPPNNQNLRLTLTKLNLPALSEEGTVLHTHQHLDIYINGKHITIPANIGIDESEGIFAPIHTHDNSGIIHVESPTVTDFTLGQFFDIWAIPFSDSCINNYCADSGHKLLLFVNGSQIFNKFHQLKLEPHQEIVITYGPLSQIPSPIPASYSFPPEY